jgi:hypothetical protein
VVCVRYIQFPQLSTLSSVDLVLVVCLARKQIGWSLQNHLISLVHRDISNIGTNRIEFCLTRYKDMQDYATASVCLLHLRYWFDVSGWVVESRSLIQ